MCVLCVCVCVCVYYLQEKRVAKSNADRATQFTCFSSTKVQILLTEFHLQEKRVAKSNAALLPDTRCNIYSSIIAHI